MAKFDSTLYGEGVYVGRDDRFIYWLENQEGKLHILDRDLPKNKVYDELSENPLRGPLNDSWNEVWLQQFQEIHRNTSLEYVVFNMTARIYRRDDLELQGPRDTHLIQAYMCIGDIFDLNH